MIRPWLLAVLACMMIMGSFAPFVHAQQENLTLAGIRVRLGMTLTEVTQAFKGSRYELRPLKGAQNAYSIQAIGGPPFESPGNLTFQNGKLWWIGKNWGNYFGPDAVSVFNAVFGILSNANGGPMDAKIDVVQTREPGVIRYEIVLGLSDGRRVALTFTDMNQVAENISVVEMLGGR